jgi:hypothetical protein
MRSSSVIVCHRVPRRCPVLRTRPAASNSRSSLSTSSRSPPVFSASADVVSPPFSNNTDSTWSAGIASNAPLARAGDALRGRLRDRGADPADASAEVSRLDCAEVFVRELAPVPRLRPLVTLAGDRRDCRFSWPSSATRAASNVLISSSSSRSRLSIDSTSSWVVLILLILRTRPAAGSRSAGRSGRQRAERSTLPALRRALLYRAGTRVLGAPRLGARCPTKSHALQPASEGRGRAWAVTSVSISVSILPIPGPNRPCLRAIAGSDTRNHNPRVGVRVPPPALSKALLLRGFRVSESRQPSGAGNRGKQGPPTSASNDRV